MEKFGHFLCLYLFHHLHLTNMARSDLCSSKSEEMGGRINFQHVKNLFGSGQKVSGSKVGKPLIYCRSKVSSGQVGSWPISTLSAIIFMITECHGLGSSVSGLMIEAAKYQTIFIISTSAPVFRFLL